MITMDCRVLESKKCTITSPYGQRGPKDFHHGVDIVKEGYQLDWIVAHSDGKVVSAVDGMGNAKGSGSYGNFVKIDHMNGWYTLYAHMEKGIKVKVGDRVKAGQRLGYMGNSGDSYGGHLHFEVWRWNERINPTSYLNADIVVNDNNVGSQYEIGDVVNIDGVYVSSTSDEKLNPKITTGTITKIIYGARNPYLLDNGNIGWVNDKCIVDTTVKYLSNYGYKGTSIVDALNQISVDSSYSYRSKLAKANGINNYTGTASQNTQMLNLLKQGKLKSA